jgi:hypothetical protein
MYKSFKTYLTESHRTYDFRVRVAGDLTSEMLDKFKRVLETYKVASFSSPKRLPIQETPEFPNMGPVQVNVFDVCVAYPANDAQIQSLLAECGCVAAACIKVHPANSPYEAIAAGTEVSNKGGKEGESVLLQDDMKTDAVPEDLVGDKRVPNLIKELEETRKYEYPEIAGGNTSTAKTTNEMPLGSASPIGTHQNKVPVARKMTAGNGR